MIGHRVRIAIIDDIWQEECILKSQDAFGVTVWSGDNFTGHNKMIPWLRIKEIVDLGRAP